MNQHLKVFVTLSDALNNAVEIEAVAANSSQMTPALQAYQSAFSAYNATGCIINSEAEQSLLKAAIAVIEAGFKTPAGLWAMPKFPGQPATQSLTMSDYFKTDPAKQLGFAFYNFYGQLLRSQGRGYFNNPTNPVNQEVAQWLDKNNYAGLPNADKVTYEKAITQYYGQCSFGDEYGLGPDECRGTYNPLPSCFVTCASSGLVSLVATYVTLLTAFPAAPLWAVGLTACGVPSMASLACTIGHCCYVGRDEVKESCASIPTLLCNWQASTTPSVDTSAPQAPLIPSNNSEMRMI